MSGIKRTVTADRIDAISVSFINGLTVAEFIAYAETLAEAVQQGLDPQATVVKDHIGNGWKVLRATSGGDSFTNSADRP